MFFYFKENIFLENIGMGLAKYKSKSTLDLSLHNTV